MARTKRRQSGAGLRALGLELLVKKLKGSNFRVTTIGHFAPPRCKIKRSTGMPRLSRNPLGGAHAAGLNIFVRRRDIPSRAIHQTVVLVVALLALFANPLDGLTRCYHCHADAKAFRTHLADPSEPVGQHSVLLPSASPYSILSLLFGDVNLNWLACIRAVAC